MKYTLNTVNHSDFKTVEIGRLAPRAYFIPRTLKKDARKADYKTERYESDMVRVLSGEWDFKFYAKESKLPAVLDTAKVKFDKITVPCTWQRTGYAKPEYINCPYDFDPRALGIPKEQGVVPPVIPEDGPCGIYRKKIEITDLTKNYIITFLGVRPCLDLYVNGSFVGYGEAAHNSFEFDITKYLTEGENEIVVAVFKWCNGSYLEAQDMFRENGIFRDVLLYENPVSYIFDYEATAKKNGKKYDLEMFAGLKGKLENLKVKFSLYDGRALVAEETVNGEEETRCTFKKLSVEEWSAEIPRLYELTVTLYSGKNEVMTLTLKWDATANDWTANSASRTEKVWNASDQQTAQIQYSWNASQLKWSPSSVTEYGYTNGKQTMVRSAKLVNGKMTYSTLYEYHFDGQGTAVGTDYYSSYNASTGQWVGSSRTVQEYIYSPKKLKTLDETYSWANGDWQVSKRQIWAFDDKGNQINTENYSKWSGGQCTNGSKTVQEFNANNRVTMKETFSWNKTKQDWVESSKTITEYDGTTANKTLEETYSWSKDHYVGQSRVRTTYSGGNAISVTNYTWDDTNRVWIESEKNENTYSGSTLTQTSSLKLENGVWVGYRTIYTYTSGKLTESLTQRFNDPDWVDYTRIRNEYSGGTNVATYEETWNGSQWVLNKKTWTVLNYDERGNKIEEAYYDSIPGLKTGSARFTYEYNEDKRQTLSTHWVWDAGDWSHDWERVYEYEPNCGDKKTLDARYEWSRGVRSGSSKSEYGYINCQQVMSASYKWNTNTQYPIDWEGLSKSETVKSTSTETQSISYKWDHARWCWTGMFRYNHWLENKKDTKKQSNKKDLFNFLNIIPLFLM